MKTEKVLAIIIVLSIGLDLMNLPMAPILVVALSVLSLVYFPGAFYFFSGKGIKEQNLFFSIVSGFFLSIIPIGILFKFMSWAGANVMLLTGLFAAIICLVVAYLLKRNAQEELTGYYRSMVLRLWVLIVVAALFYAIPASIFSGS